MTGTTGVGLSIVPRVRVAMRRVGRPGGALASLAAAALPVVFALATSVAFVNVLGPSVFTVAGLDLEVRATIGRPGSSSVSIPPLGTVTARTHPVPVALDVALKNVEPKGFSESLRLLSPEGQGTARGSGSLVAEFADSMRSRAPSFLVRFALKQLALAFAGGVLGAYLCRRRLRTVVTAALIAAAMVGLVLGSTALAFDASAFARPSYHGVIEAAPWALGLINGNLAKLSGLGESVKAVSRNILTVFSQVDRLSAMTTDPGLVRLLHVSDIHNNPASLRLVLEVARLFGVDAVVDSGDVTDFGTPIEAELVAGVGQLGVPYLVVGGNHDSPAVLARLARCRNVRVLRDGPVTIRGITIAGQDDPWMGSPMGPGASESPDGAAALEASRKELADPGSKVRSAVARQQAALGREATGVPDVLVVHRFAQVSQLVAEGGPLAGTGLILCGHDHSAGVSFLGETVVSDAGSTGGEGLRGLARGGPTGGANLTMSVIYVLRRPVAVDTIRLEPDASGFTLQRILVGARDAADGTGPQQGGQAESE